MARIRTIKPEFWTDEALSECSPTSRLLFIATWNFADDYGNLEASVRQLKAQVFPYDTLDITPLVQELVNAGLLIPYGHEGKNYLHIKGFDKHQKVEKKSAAKHPPFTGSPPTLRIVGESSASSCGSLLEGKGREESKTAADAAAPKAKRTRTEKHPLPADFALDDAMREQMLKRHYDCDVDQSFVQFRAYHETRDSRFASWRAAWTTWVGNAERFGYPRRTSGSSLHAVVGMR
jgi:hypothetical protein